MSETPEFVQPGTRIYAASGQYLEVTDQTAVGMHGRLYQTTAWAARTAATREVWAGRSWWRRWLDLPPKGYEPQGTPTPGLFGSIAGSLFG